MAADAFYLLNYIDCIDDEEQTLPENRLDARHSSSGVWKSIFLRPSIVGRPLQSTHTLELSARLFSGVQRRHLASKLSSSSVATAAAVTLPSAGQTFTN